MPAAYILALDFGGTKLAAAVLDVMRGVWLAKGDCPAPSAQGAQAVRARMLALAEAHLAAAAAAAAGAAPVAVDAAVAAVGVSFDGPVDPSTGVVRACHHVAGWTGYALRDDLAARYGAPTVVENDARAAALGEWRYGAGRGCRDMLYVTVSTGVGGGLILGGQLYRGPQGLAGEIGHMGLDPQGPPCPCGRRGCLEALAAGPAIVRHAQRALAASDAPSALRGRPVLSAQQVSQTADQGDALALGALRQSAEALGAAIGNALNLLNLERVVVGGGVTRAGPRYLAWVAQAAHERALAGVAVEIRLAELGAEAPLWGAASLATALIG